MPYESIFYLICSSVSITISISVALLFWERRKTTGAMCISLMLAFAAQWTLCDLLSVLSDSFAIKEFWNKLAYSGAIIIPVLWLIFSLQYTKNGKYLTRKNLLLLALLPSMTVFMIWTNSVHHLFTVRFDLAKAGLLSVIVPSYGTWFWIHVTFSYLSILSGSIIIFRNLASLPQAYRNQSIIMALAVLVPFMGSILYSLRIIPSYPVDPTMFSFSFSGILFFFGMFKFRLFTLVPTARAAVIESMEELVIVLDNQNHIIDINSSALSILKLNSKNLVGQSLYCLLDAIPFFFAKYLDVMSAKDKITLLQDNQNKYYDLTITPLYDNKNRIHGRYIIMRDITVLEDALENSERSRKAAEVASKAKSQFLATISHEIRTPLNGIIGMSELMNSARLTDDERGYMLSIQTSANSLLEIINDVLDFSKIEAGKLELDETDFNIGDLISSTVKMFQYKALERNLILKSHISDDIPVSLTGDPLRLRQVLVNLLGNSLKFTEEGQIQINAEKLKHEDKRVLLRISVTDTGIGISQDKLAKLFNSFEQLDNSTTRKYGGTGLGLAIVKNLITMMGGTIEVESKPGYGSSFVLILPFLIADSQLSDKTAKVSSVEFHRNNIRVLLAEDNKVNQVFMKKLLERRNLRVEIAENGKMVLEKFNEHEYDLILMDIQMPEMDGYEAASQIRIREASNGKHIPIIALTANATEEDRNKCFQTGMDDYISKPVRSERLFSCIKKYVR